MLQDDRHSFHSREKRPQNLIPNSRWELLGKVAGVSDRTLLNAIFRHRKMDQKYKIKRSDTYKSSKCHYVTFTLTFIIILHSLQSSVLDSHCPTFNAGVSLKTFQILHRFYSCIHSNDLTWNKYTMYKIIPPPKAIYATKLYNFFL